ncbi:MAG: type IV secretion system protein [Actinobacteria bacterium]|nr:type IV secretion system protein [Actinomycetota bacterium]
MRARLRRLGSRRVLWTLGLAALFVLLASPPARADIWANVGPASPLGGLAGRYPLGNYALDEHFTAISAGVFEGVDVSGLLPMIAYFFADLLWQGTAWLADVLIELFGFAFSLDLLNGSGATGGAGALGPVSRAIHSIYADVFGGPWMIAAVSVAGGWATWRALVQRRYAETAGQLALSLIYVIAALFFVWQPAQTIGVASQWTNSMSGAFLSIAKDGEPASQEEAKEAGADQLFGLLVAQPWAVLEFGGLDHCVRTGSGSEGSEPESVAVQPLPASAARGLESGQEVSAGGKTCVDNLKKYGDHFLRFASGSDERNEEFEALQKGDASKLPGADPSKAKGDYRLSAVDEPAAAAMEKEGQYQRLLVAVVVFVCELGAFCLLGALSIGVITAQVLLLLLLAFSPVALVAAVIPGRGHQFFKGWLSKLAGFLLRKAAYSLVLAILLAVCAAISAATSELGWLFSFGLQCAFFWAVFLQRRALTDGLVGTVTGPGVPGSGRALDLIALYAGARLGTREAARPVRAAGRGASRTARRIAGRRGDRHGRVAPTRVRDVPLGGVRRRQDGAGHKEDREAEGRRGRRPGGRRDPGGEPHGREQRAGGDREPARQDRREAASEGARSEAKESTAAETKEAARPDRRPDGGREKSVGGPPSRAPEGTEESKGPTRPATSRGGKPPAARPGTEPRPGAEDLSDRLRADRERAEAARRAARERAAKGAAGSTDPKPSPPAPPRPKGPGRSRPDDGGGDK